MKRSKWISFVLLFGISACLMGAETCYLRVPDNASGLYPPWWTPGYTVPSPEGDLLRLQDFSYAGYHNGESSLPDTSQGFTQITVAGDPSGVSDSSAAFQSAINSAENAASVTGGCIINIPAGEYRLETPLVIEGSGVILKGAGKGLTKLYFPTPGENGTPSIHFKGNVTPASNPYDFHVSESGAKGDHYLYLERDGSTYYLNPAYGFNEGKPIDAVISFRITQSFINAHGMGEWWTENDLNQRKDFFRTEITQCSDLGSRYVVKIKAPLRYDTRRSFQYTDTQPQLRVYRGYLQECGIEDLSISNAVSYKDAWHDEAGELRRGVYAVRFSEAKDCWIRNVESYATDRVAHTSGSVLEDDTTFELPFIGGGVDMG